MRNYFSKRPSVAPFHTLSKLYDVPVGFVIPPPYFEAVYCFICAHRRVTVVRYRMICLVLDRVMLRYLETYKRSRRVPLSKMFT